MSNTKPTKGFTKGNTHAADNNNQRKMRIRKSKLRKTEEALRALEPKSLENIKLSVEGKNVDKESLATSKWVLTNIMAVGKAAAAEEELINGTRLMLNEAERLEAEREAEESEEDAPVKPRFSTTMVVPFPTAKDLE